MHFFSPVEKMPLLEVIPTDATAPEAIVTAVRFGRRMGKTVIVVADRPGFWVNRILSPYLNEAGLLVAEGVPIELIDRTATAWGFPVGPVALLDEIGLDVAHKAAETMHAAFGERMKGGKALDRMLAAGRLGRKNGRGFYRYRNGHKRGPDPTVYGVLGIRPNRGRRRGAGRAAPGVRHAERGRGGVRRGRDPERPRRRHRRHLRHRLPGLPRRPAAAHRRPRRLARRLHPARAGGPVRRAVPARAGAGGDGPPGRAILSRMTGFLRLLAAGRRLLSPRPGRAPAQRIPAALRARRQPDTAAPAAGARSRRPQGDRHGRGRRPAGELGHAVRTAARGTGCSSATATPATSPRPAGRSTTPGCATLGLSLFAFDYRGYGESEGVPSEEGLYRDADAAYRYLRDTLGVPPERIVIFGHSLGSAVAVELASRVPAAGLILDGALTSVVERAQEMFPYAPVRWIAASRYPSIERVGRPHPAEAVPPRPGRRGDPHRARPAAVRGGGGAEASSSALRGGHGDAFEVDSAAYFGAIGGFVAGLRGR